MPIDLDKVSQIKERILSIIRLKGPVMPIHIAKALNISPLFTSAFLSELFSERKVFMSHMKIGSSSLYLLPGQEPMLENFIDSLNHREKEATLLLKSKKILEDESLTPVIRVALRSVKDFAIPVRIKISGDTKLFWKYFLVPDSDIKTILQDTIIQSPLPEQAQQKLPVEKTTEKTVEKTPEKAMEKPIEEKTPVPKIIPNVIERHPEKNKEKDTAEKKEEREDNEEKLKSRKEKTKKTKEKESDFTRKIKEYLTAKEIEILEIIEEKKKDFIAKIRTDESFGKQEYLLFAKDKKKISELDLILTIQKAQENKMLALIMTPGEIDKKAQDYYKSWKNLIKLHKIKI